MKAKRRTFGSFFTRIGAGFLAFWLAVMAMFTVLVSQQRAELMLSDMDSKSNRLMGEDTDILLDPSTYEQGGIHGGQHRPAEPANRRNRHHRPEHRRYSAKQPLVAGTDRGRKPVPRGYERSAARGVRDDPCGCGRSREKHRIAAGDDL